MIRMLQVVVLIAVAAACGNDYAYDKLTALEIPQWTENAVRLFDLSANRSTEVAESPKFVLLDTNKQAFLRLHGIDKSELQKQVWARDMMDVATRLLKPGTHYDGVVEAIGEPDRVAMGNARDPEGVVTYVWLDDQVGMTMIMFREDRLAAVLPCW